MCLTWRLGRKGMTSEPLRPGVINLTGPLESSRARFMVQKESVQSSSVKPFGVRDQVQSCSATSGTVAGLPDGVCQSLRCVK